MKIVSGERAKMKKIALLVFFSSMISLSSYAESPCAECLELAKNILTTCQSKAKTDAQRSECNEKAQTAIANCLADACKN